jgi:hypothetical protein
MLAELIFVATSVGFDSYRPPSHKRKSRLLQSDPIVLGHIGLPTVPPSAPKACRSVRLCEAEVVDDHCHRGRWGVSAASRSRRNQATTNLRIPSRRRARLIAGLGAPAGAPDALNELPPDPRPATHPVPTRRDTHALGDPLLSCPARGHPGARPAGGPRL